MFPKSYRPLLALLAALATGTAALAQTRDDGGLWLMYFAQGRLGAADSALRDFRWWVDVQPRQRDEGEHLDQFLARPGLGYALHERFTAWAGYALIVTDPLHRDEYLEHRTWQQTTWNLPVEGFTLQWRNRLEERFVETDGDTGWRLREFVKATLPLADDRSPFLSVYDEVFFELNDTDWGQRQGCRQNRAFGGIGWFVDAAHRTSVEVGYLNQWIDRPGEDKLNHILSVNLLMNF